MLRITFKTNNGRQGYRTIDPTNTVFEDGATHLFRCNDGNGWYTRGVCVRKDPAAYIAWRKSLGNNAELLGSNPNFELNAQ